MQSELVDALVDEVSEEPGGLPLLSTALVELWRVRSGGWIRLEAYQRTGGLLGAVARMAEESFSRLEGSQREAARSVLMRLAMGNRLPMPVPLEQWVVEGGLFYYGINHRATGRGAARYVDKLLKGTAPAALPVEQPATFNLVINRKTADALGLTIPPTILFQATEVIQ